MRESGAWKAIRGAIKHLDPVRVENPAHPGTPDVNYIGGWLELKRLSRLPDMDKVLQIDHYTPQQRSWAFRRIARGGRCFMLISAGKHWILMRGDVAATSIGFDTTAVVLQKAIKVWTTRPTSELAKLLTS